VSHVAFDSTRTQLSGYGGRIRIGKGSKGLWRYSTELNWRSPGLDLNDIGFMPTADILKLGNSLSYFVNQPELIFRTWSIELTQTSVWDFGLRHLSSGGAANLHLDFLNNWGFFAGLSYAGQALDPRILRGGPAMLVPQLWTLDTHAQTDPSARFQADCGFDVSAMGEGSSRSLSVQPEISFMPFNTLKLSAGVNSSSNLDNLQYVAAVDPAPPPVPDPISPGARRYILARIDQHTLGLTFRLDYNLTPEFSVQYYGSPFVSVGRYSEFKAVAEPRAGSYRDRFERLDLVSSGTTCLVSDAGNHRYAFDNPDFDFAQFRSILVLRWEYRPGSQLFLVWSHERTQYAQPGYASVGDAMSGLNDVYPGNVFLAKISYWFSL
jgi:hypothetical protein